MTLWAWQVVEKLSLEILRLLSRLGRAITCWCPATEFELSEGLAQTQYRLNYLIRGCLFPILMETGLWRHWICWFSTDKYICSWFSYESSWLGGQNRMNKHFPLSQMKTGLSGNLPSWLELLPLGHELFNSLEMGASQPGQQRGGSWPCKGKLLPVMTFFHLCISHSAAAV